jgi:hypothetical protein
LQEIGRNCTKFQLSYWKHGYIYKTRTSSCIRNGSTFIQVQVHLMLCSYEISLSSVHLEASRVQGTFNIFTTETTGQLYKSLPFFEVIKSLAKAVRLWKMIQLVPCFSSDGISRSWQRCPLPAVLSPALQRPQSCSEVHA